MKKGDLFRMRGSHRPCIFCGSNGDWSQVDFNGVRRWVKTNDLMQPIAEGSRWMRPWVDGDVLETFFKWLFSDKNEKRIQWVVGVAVAVFILIQIVRYVFSV